MIGYVPQRSDLDSCVDRRRFPWYCGLRGIGLKVVDRPGTEGCVVVTGAGDLTTWARAPPGQTVVYDMVDSYLLASKSLVNLVRAPGKSLLRRYRYPALSEWSVHRRMCERADAVVCATEGQARVARQFCDNVHIILDDHSEVPMPEHPPDDPDEGNDLLWEGTPHTLRHIRTIGPVIRQAQAIGSVGKLKVVTDATSPRFAGRFGTMSTRRFLASLDGVDSTFVPWSQANLAEATRSAACAFIALPDDDAFAWNKPANKLLLLWRLGIPTLASATPEYVRVSREAGLEDLLCRRYEDWADQLDRFGSGRADVGGIRQRARRYLELHHSPAVLARKWDTVLDSVGIDIADDAVA